MSTQHEVQRAQYTLTHTQKKALLCFAGYAPRTIQTNHQIDGERALINKGLIDSRWEGWKNVRKLTDFGKSVALAVAKAEGRA